MSTKRSYKAEFLRWKAEVEKKHGKMIYDRLSEVIDTDDDLAVGDTVLFTNDYGVTFGPHEVLGFCRPDSFLCPHRYPEDEDCGIVFSDNDVLAVGKGIEKIELVPIGPSDSHTYYRENGTHYVPKLRAEELTIKE